MKVYIFGAGASLASQGNQELSPKLTSPLVDQLFDPTYEVYASSVFVSKEKIRQLKSQIGDTSLEEWLTTEWVRIGEPHGKEALAAGRKTFGDLALYTWWLMCNVSLTYSEVNGYRAFLQKLVEVDDKDENAFINFNYDLLLDKALVKELGYDLSGQLEKYTNVNYLKPHGSVNWFVNMRSTDSKIAQEDQAGGQHEVLLNRIAGSMFRGEPIDKTMKILDPLNTNLYNLRDFFRDTYGVGNYGFPLIMLPLSAKMHDLVTGFMDRMRAEFGRIFSQASDIYVIGYRANDELFREMVTLARRGTKLHVVGRSNAKEIQDAILSEPDTKLVAGNVYTDGFLDFIKNGMG
jgi:hypothetical protein